MLLQGLEARATLHIHENEYIVMHISADAAGKRRMSLKPRYRQMTGTNLHQIQIRISSDLQKLGWSSQAGVKASSHLKAESSIISFFRNEFMHSTMCKSWDAAPVRVKALGSVRGRGPSIFLPENKMTVNILWLLWLHPLCKTTREGGPARVEVPKTSEGRVLLDHRWSRTPAAARVEDSSLREGRRPSYNIWPRPQLTMRVLL